MVDVNEEKALKLSSVQNPNDLAEDLEASSTQLDRSYVPTVTVHADTNGTHTLQIYSGLYDLEAAGKIKLKFGRGISWLRNRSTRQVIAVSIENQRGVALICCFDVQDDCEIAAPIALERADVYFKRSYSHLAL